MVRYDRQPKRGGDVQPAAPVRLQWGSERPWFGSGYLDQLERTDIRIGNWCAIEGNRLRR